MDTNKLEAIVAKFSHEKKKYIKSKLHNNAKLNS